MESITAVHGEFNQIGDVVSGVEFRLFMKGSRASSVYVSILKSGNEVLKKFKEKCLQIGNQNQVLQTQLISKNVTVNSQMQKMK